MPARATSIPPGAAGSVQLVLSIPSAALAGATVLYQHSGSGAGTSLPLQPAAAPPSASATPASPATAQPIGDTAAHPIVLADGSGVLEPDDFTFDNAREPVVGEGPSTPLPGARGGSVFEEIAEAEAERIKDALRRAGGSRARAARILGIPRTTLNDRLRRYEIT